MIKLSLGWMIAGIAALGTAAYVALSPKSSSSPKTLTKVPFNPGEDDCDIAYGQLPDDVQEAYNNAVIAANVDTAKLTKVKNLVQAIAKDPDIDDVAKRTFQKCFWKKAAMSGQATIAEAIAAVPSLANVLAGNALGEGDKDDEDDEYTGATGSDDDEDVDDLYGKKPGYVAPPEYNASDPRLALNQLTYTPPAYVGPWPAIQLLPMPYHSQALNVLGDTNYYAVIGKSGGLLEYANAGLNAASGGDATNAPLHTCGPLCNAHATTVQAYADQLASMNGALFGKNGAAIRDAAVAELEAAARLLWANGMP